MFSKSCTWWAHHHISMHSVQEHTAVTTVLAWEMTISNDSFLKLSILGINLSLCFHSGVYMMNWYFIPSLYHVKLKRYGPLNLVSRDMLKDFQPTKILATQLQGLRTQKAHGTENSNFFWLFTWSLAMSASKNITNKMFGFCDIGP